MLSDDQLLEILSFFDALTLMKLSTASKALHVYCNIDELWRDLVLGNKEGVRFFTKSWKNTFMKAICKNLNSSTNFDTHFGGIFSDSLHRSWYCSQFNIAEHCPGFFELTDIERLNCEKITVAQFVAKYEQPNKPVIIQNAVSSWTAFEKWTEDYLVKVSKGATFRATSATASLSAAFTMSSYFQYASQAQEEVPLYLFERDFAAIAPELESSYEVPAYFSASAPHGSDLFRLLGPTARPDYRWLIIGPARSGSIFHIDPNQTNAWNVSIRGRKKWIFYPPDVSPPGVAASPDGADVAVPISTGEWLLSFWKFHLEARRHPDPSKRPMEAILNPGEVMFVPHGYWHMVVNLEPCIALTHNYVSTSNLSDCLHFLREKRDQISGLRDRQDAGAISPESLYECFIEKLREELGEEKLQDYVRLSMKAPESYSKKRKQRSIKGKSQSRRIESNTFASSPTLADTTISTEKSTEKLDFHFQFNFQD